MLSKVLNSSNEWFDQIRQKISDFSNSQNWLIRLGFYLGLGFLLGFIFKYCIRPIILLIISVVAILWLLHLAGAVTINYELIKNTFGIASDTSFQDLAGYYAKWAQSHVAECVATLLGIFLAFELI